MKKNASDQKINIQLRIERRDCPRQAHHLRGVLDEAAAPGVMIFASCGRATKSVAPLVDECFAQCAKARINNRAIVCAINSQSDLLALRANPAGTFQQFFFFLVRSVVAPSSFLLRVRIAGGHENRQ